MSNRLNIKTLIAILIAGVLLTSATSMPVANAQPTQTSLTLAVPHGPRSKEWTIEATLKDKNGNPLLNMDIDFYICGSEKIGTAKTDSNGVASLTYTFSTIAEIETYPIKAMFSGTTSYDPSSSEYVDITIIDWTPYLVPGGIIAVTLIGVIGYFFVHRSKQAITMPMTAKEA